MSQGNLSVSPFLERETTGYFIGNNNIFKLDLSEHAKILYLFLCRLSDAGKTSFPSYLTMSKNCGFSRSTAIRATKDLLKIGILEKRFQMVSSKENGKKEQSSNIYRILNEPNEEVAKRNQEQLHAESKMYSSRLKEKTGIKEEEPESVQENQQNQAGQEKPADQLPSVTEEPGSVTGELGSVSVTPYKVTNYKLPKKDNTVKKKNNKRAYYTNYCIPVPPEKGDYG